MTVTTFQSSPSAPLSAVAGRLVAIAVATFVCTRAVLDPDLWWHLRAGLDLLATRDLTFRDPYSFTQDVPWINHEWLSEAIMAIAYRAAGVPGLIVLKCALTVAVIALLAAAARRVSEPARWWMFAASAVALNFSAVTIRPQLWTLLGVAVMFWSSSRGWSMLASRTAVVLLPALFGLWANLHGGWIVGLAIAGLWLVGRSIDLRSVRAVAPAAVGLGLGFAATVVNPYGVTLWTFLLTTVRVSRDLTEWHPVWQQEGPTETVTWLIVSAAIVIPTVVRHRRAVSWAAALPLGWLAVMSLLVARMLPIYGEVALLCLADAWRSSDGKPSPSSPGGDVVAAQRARASGFTPLVIDGLVVIAIAAANLVPQSRGLTTDRSWIPDYEAAAGISGSYAAGRLVVPYDWGGFALWHWGPRLRVSVDPRRETVYSERTIAIQTDVEYGRPDGIAFLDRERPEYIWLPVPRAASVKAWARDHGYRIDVETGRSFVATRSDLPRLSPGPTLSECFP